MIEFLWGMLAGVVLTMCVIVIVVLRSASADQYPDIDDEARA